MKADLPRKEKEYLAEWKHRDIYAETRKRLAGKPLFLLHDGPPYANGHLHMGHAMNKILKDMINRVAIKQGKNIAYVPGWDCHGLPIEHKVLKDLGKRRSDLSALEIRKKCRESAMAFAAIQKEEFIRMGVLADWDHPYLTMDFRYEANILRSLATLAESGRVYKGEKPVLWCGTCETALADAEVEYAPHKSTSLTVLFRSVAPGPTRYFPIWTTTPWTLPANQAVAVNPDLSYVVLKLDRAVGILEAADEIVLAEKLRDQFLLGDNSWSEILNYSSVLERVSGATLIGEDQGLRHPLLEGRIVPLVAGAFVETDQGTGLVHIAPGHGEEDFFVGRENHLTTETPVNEKGRFSEKIADIDPELAGVRILEATTPVTGHLERTSTLLFKKEITHSYPHCWRCKNPVYTRATSQWFLSLETDNLRQKTLEAISRVQWIPEKGETRIRGMIENRPDWCLSRQRAWGVPIPAVTCNACRTSHLEGAFIRTLAKRTENEGIDFWFDPREQKALLQAFRCPDCGGGDLTAEEDILDVWFDSGVSHEAVLKQRADMKWPADLYLEGSDQHRGWFHSSLLTSMALEGSPPYNAVLTHGFVVDGQGKKMAKTMGNVISPSEIIDKYGADVLRLWVAASDYQEDTKLSAEILNNLVDGYRKIRNTFRFMINNLFDGPSGTGSELDPLDRWILSIWERTRIILEDAYKTHRFGLVVQTLNNFCSISLSAQYFDMIKDRLYAEKHDSALRRGTQHTLAILLEELTAFIHPILPFTSEEIAKSSRGGRNAATDSAAFEIIATPFPEQHPERIEADLEKTFNHLLSLRAEFGKMTDELKKEKIIGNTTEVSLRITGKTAMDSFSHLSGSLMETFFIVSGWSWAAGPSLHTGGKILVSSVHEASGLTLDILEAPGEKCQRCWLKKESTGKNIEQWPLCTRCFTVVRDGPSTDPDKIADKNKI